MSTTSQVADWIVRSAGALSLPGAVGWWVKERRKNRVAARVAERTENAEVRKEDASALVAEVAAIEKAFSAERESYGRLAADQQRRITELITELGEARTALQTARDERQHLADRLEAQDVELQQLRKELAGVKAALRAGGGMAP